MKYEPLPKLTREEAEVRLRTTDTEELCVTVAALPAVDDAAWVEQQLRSFLDHPHPYVLGNAAVALTDLVRAGHSMDTTHLRRELEQRFEDRPDAARHLRSALMELEE